MIYFNGEFINDTPIFEFQDRIRLGDGVFDTMLVIIESPPPSQTSTPRLIHAPSHLSRILHNAKLVGMGIESLSSASELEHAAKELITRNNLPAGRYALNTLITRGIAERGLLPQQNTEPNIAMRIAKVPDDFPPIHAIISETVRLNEGSPLSQIKSCNYGDNILALLEAQDKGANEAILLNNKGNVTCASAGNIFACMNDELVTPPLSDGVMDGVTRKIIIEKFAAVERSITADELLSASGIYITNSIKGVMPVSSLNGKTLPKPSIKIDKDAHLEE